ncbi:hypothetical protein GCM10011297_03360 [Bacterioplanes sanyensis]|uniref:hypothetical protein n=1 Tax=Bacterioplanes sanyensis TaxID=1249553 RepID=UPI00167AA79D|nr:hypothetical protein [Bacterioplanes sanyensis]GGY33685.1 hypothetical protein GCM10011297_03360 [Bacterioplanes sanyensis]
MYRVLMWWVLCCPLLALADDAELMRLHAMAYKVTADASLISLRQGDAMSRQRLAQTLQATQTQVDALASQWPQLGEQWQLSREFIEANIELAAANGDVRYPVNLDERQQALYQAIEQAREQNQGANERAVLRALIALEQTVAGYLYFNINVFGGLSATDNIIETATQSFRQALPGLPEPLRQRVERKWSFIEGAVLDYNQNSAVFIVRRTTDSIRDMLSEALVAQEN